MKFSFMLVYLHIYFCMCAFRHVVHSTNEVVAPSYVSAAESDSTDKSLVVASCI